MMHSFGYSAMVFTSTHPGKMPLKTTASRENNIVSRHEKECNINNQRSSWAIPVPLLLKVAGSRLSFRLLTVGTKPRIWKGLLFTTNSLWILTIDNHGPLAFTLWIILYWSAKTLIFLFIYFYSPVTLIK